MNEIPNFGIPAVTLDAGHYGTYNRSTVVPAFTEGEVNWRLQELLAAALEARGIRALRTRNRQDVDLDLVQRGQAAKDTNLFVSLHVNAADNRQADYVLGIHMVDDGTARARRSRQAAELLAPAVSKVMDDAPVNIWSRQSSQDRDGNGQKDDYYGVLRGAVDADVPGIILEHGFYTNEKQARWLLEDEHLRKLAQAEADAIVQWFATQRIGNPYTLALQSLHPDSYGPPVQVLQMLLTTHGYPVDADSKFGPGTRRALTAFQQARGLEPDGKVGPQTLKVLLGYSNE